MHIFFCNKDVDYVFNLAAVTSPPEFEDIDSKGYEINIIGTYNILKSAYKNNVKRVILASSSAIYGNIKIPTTEDMITNSHPNLYAVTKYTNEITARSFSLLRNLDSVYLRYFNTYGSGENNKGAYSSIFHKFIDNLRHGEIPLIFGDGTQKRDFIYVEALQKILPQIQVSNRTFDVSILYHIKRNGYNIKEIPVTWNHDSNSRMPIKAAIIFMFFTLLAIKLLNSRIKDYVPEFLFKIVSKFKVY